ncbi:MAG: hypothetical protein KGI89_16475, partial [Euryarchaeota archaeon]|nr:hypothetical protein [Euryarchaeota archaeon]
SGSPPSAVSYLGVYGRTGTLVADYDLTTTAAPVSAVAYSATTGDAYFASEGSGTITSWNMPSGTSTGKTAAVGGYPVEGLTADPRTGTVFATELEQDSVAAFSESTYALTSNVQIGVRPALGLYDPGAGTIYIGANEFPQGAVYAISVVTHQVIAHFAIAQPEAMVLDGSAGLLFVASSSSSSVSVISDVSNKVVRTIPVGQGPDSLALDTALSEVFVADETSNDVDVIGVTSLSVVASIVLNHGGPLNLTYDAALGEVFALSSQGSVDVISDTANAEVGAISLTLTPRSSVLDPSSGKLWVGAGNSATTSGLVGLIDPSSNQEVAQVSVWGAPTSLLFDPENLEVFAGTSAGLLYAVSDGAAPAVMANLTIGPPGELTASYDDWSGEVLVSDASGTTPLGVAESNDSLVVHLQVGLSPSGVVSDLESSTAIVANSGSGSVSFLALTPPPLVVSSFTANTSTPMVGYSLEMRAIAQGGRAPFSYSYLGLPLGCSSADTAWLNCTPSAPGTFKVEVDASDLVGQSAYSNLTLRVTDLALLAQLAANTTSGYVGFSFELWANGSGGYPPYSYSYTGLPAGCLSADVAVLDCTPTSPGTASLVVSIKDHLGQVTTSSLSLPVSLRPVSVRTFTVAPTLVHPGQELWLNVSASGGNAPLFYAYTGLPTGCTSYDTAALVCIPQGTGKFVPLVNVSDSQGMWSRLSTTVQVSYPTISIGSVTVAPSPVDYGAPLWINVTASGGTPPLSYHYEGLPAGCTSSDAPSLQCFPTASGSFPVVVNVSDAVGVWSTWKGQVVVNQLLSKLQLSPGPTVSLVFGGIQNFIGEGLNATGSFLPGVLYTWSITPDYLGFLNATTGTHVELYAGSTPGTGTLWVNTSTYDGVALSTQDRIYVSATAGPSISSFAPDPSSIYLGETAYISVAASGGTGSLTYSYPQLPPGCVSANEITLPCTPQATGTFPLEVDISDQAGHTVMATSELTVTPATPADVLSSIQVNPQGPINLGLSLPQGFTAIAENAAGAAIPGVILIWTLSPSSIGTLNATSGRAVTLETGQDTVKGTLNVSATFGGVTRWALVAINVAPAGGTQSEAGPTILGLSEFDFVSLIVAIAAVVAPISFEIWKRNKERQERREEKRTESEKKGKGAEWKEESEPLTEDESEEAQDPTPTSEASTK